MRILGVCILCIILISNQNILAQTNENIKEYQTELIITDEQKTIFFTIFIISVLGVIMYLSRDIILRKKTEYDSKEFDSKKDKTFEKYHSQWTDEYEEIGHRIKSEKKEFTEFDNSLKKNYYEILGIPQDAKPDEIKIQYRDLVKKTHPDRNKDKKSEKKMAEINEAYDVLSDKDLRMKYDIFLSES